ncbi:MAG: FGGY family carbohydrate kinase [Nitrososphaeria archaeon]
MFLSIDLGTSALKVCIYDLNFNTIAKCTTENITYFPEPNWCEQDQMEWWEKTKKLIREALKISKIDPSVIMGVGICGQCHGPNLVNKLGNPLYPCIIWPDLRSIPEAEEIKKMVGVNVSPYYTAAKLLWIRKHYPNLLERTYKILLPKDFLRTKLTKDFCTDIWDAYATQLYNPNKLSYDEKLVDYIKVPLEKLPDIHLSTEVVGTICEEASTETGLPSDIPVIAGKGDGSPDLLGYFTEPYKTILIYLGTAPAVLIPTENKETLFPFIAGFMGAGGGALLKWFKENFGVPEENVSSALGISAYSLLDQEAEKLEVGSGNLLFLPHMMGERAPHNPEAKGVLYGLSLGHTKVHVYRSILEGIALHLYNIYNSLKEQNARINPNKIILFGGGAKSYIWKKIFADIFNLPVYSLVEEETATMNVAVLTSVGVGVYKDIEEAVKRIKIKLKDKVTPSQENHERYTHLNNKYKELEKKLFQHETFLPEPF